MIRQDSKGQEYWKYKPLREREEGERSQTEPAVNEARSTKSAEFSVQTNSAPAKVEGEKQPQAIEESEQIKRFREKFGEYGKPNQSQEFKQ